MNSGTSSSRAHLPMVETKEVNDMSGKSLRRQAGNGSSASVVAVFAMVVIVLILLLAWYGFFGNGRWFGSGGGNGVNVTVHTSP